MRGYPDNNAPAFHKAARFLRAKGWDVWSSAEHDEVLGVEASNADLKRTFLRDIQALVECDGIVLMEGWDRSVGAKLERHFAEVVGLQVYFLTAGGTMIRSSHPIEVG